MRIVPDTIDLVVIGGGAAGIFAAICAKTAHPQAQVVVLEKTGVLLSKVKVSGGGRCNVTHACFEPGLLVKNYPRGEKELLGPFHRFQPRDIVEWFQSRGVRLKTEPDGRMFPVTNSSSTIIECLLTEARKLGVEIRLQQRVEKIEKGFKIYLKDKEPLQCQSLILATGSSPEGFQFAQSLGHAIVPPVPSLFTFNVPTSPLKDLSGVSVPAATVTLGPYSRTGPLLITHFGFSGPAILKLSAWGAKYLHEKNYKTEFIIDWGEIESLPKSLRNKLSTSKETYLMDGKTTHKEEFVTCGGIDLKEVHFKTMESKICPGLFFAGEILNIDGITGGFNFQNAWTTGYLAGSSV